MMPAVASMPIFVASGGMSVATASICAATKSGDSVTTPVTPSVFWAVTAVIADMPKTPCAANVFRSAWMPAPPLESLPAIVRAVRIPIESLIMIVQASSASTGSILSLATGQADARVAVRAAGVALAVMLTAVAAQFTSPLPFTAVPFTLAPLAVMLTGAALGFAARIPESGAVSRRGRRGTRRVRAVRRAAARRRPSRGSDRRLSAGVSRGGVRHRLARRARLGPALSDVAREHAARAWPSSSPAACRGCRSCRARRSRRPSPADSCPTSRWTS